MDVDLTLAEAEGEEARTMEAEMLGKAGDGKTSITYVSLVVFTPMALWQRILSRWTTEEIVTTPRIQ